MAEINLNDFKPNSNAKKDTQEQPKKKVNSVVSKKPRVIKKGKIRRFLGNFSSEDPSTVKNSIVTGVIVPEIKRMLDDIVHTILYPNGGSRRNDRSSYLSYFFKVIVIWLQI